MAQSTMTGLSTISRWSPGSSVTGWTGSDASPSTDRTDVAEAGAVNVPVVPIGSSTSARSRSLSSRQAMATVPNAVSIEAAA